MSNYKRADCWLGASLIVMLVAGCGVGSGADKDLAEANTDSSIAAKLQRVALAKLCEQGVACEAEQVGQAIKTLGSMLEELPTEGQLKQLANSDDVDAPPSTAEPDMAVLMEMLKSVAGTDAFGSDDADGVARVAAAPSGPDVVDQVSEAKASTSEADLIVALGGIPVSTGKLTVAELREQLLTPTEAE